MAEIQSLRKIPTMKRIGHLKEAFVKRIQRSVKIYSEARIIFDRYDLPQSLKEKTREKRAKQADMNFEVHDEMVISKIPLKDLLSSSQTKAGLSNLFGDSLVHAFNGSDKKVVIVKGTTAQANAPHRVDESMLTHSHEEADSMIPLHVIDAIKGTTVKDVYVSSPDTDVLILLMDLVSNGHLGALTKLHFLTRKGAKFRSINVCERVTVIGQEKCQGRIGLHNFTGADWGGKFIGVSKKTWISACLSLSDSDPIVNSFRLLGTGVLSSNVLVDGELPQEVI